MASELRSCSRAAHDEADAPSVSGVSEETDERIEQTAIQEIPGSRPRKKVISKKGLEVSRTRTIIPSPVPRLGLDDMKENVRKSLIKPTYNVANYYKAEGVFPDIARHDYFDKFTLVIITLNALWIWVDTDLNKAVVFTQAKAPFQIVEHIFCVYFSFEWTCRFLSFRRKRDGLRDAWFVFDSCLVFMMVMETWVMTAILFASGGGAAGGLGNASILRMARLLRLSRMARMVRLFRAMPELLILMKGIVAATRSVFFTLLLLVILLYVFAIALRQLTDGTEMGEAHFSTVLASMYTLLIDGTFMDNLGELARSLGQDNPVCGVIFWLFVLASSLTVMNMLIGVLCEVVSAVAASEREGMQVAFVKDRMKPLFETLDESGDGLISKSEFLGILDKPEAIHLLEEVGIDVIFLLDQSDSIFDEDTMLGQAPDEKVGKSLDFEKLMTIILDLRGTTQATVRHIVQLRKQLLEAISCTHFTMADIKLQLQELDIHSCGVSEVSTHNRRHDDQCKVMAVCAPAGKVEASVSEPSLAEDAWQFPIEKPLFKHAPDKVPIAPMLESSKALCLESMSLLPASWPRGKLEGSPSAPSVPQGSPFAGLSDAPTSASTPARMFGSRGPRPGHAAGGLISQPGGDAAVPEPEISINCLVERLEHVAMQALVQVHQDLLRGISTAVRENMKTNAHGVAGQAGAMPGVLPVMRRPGETIQTNAQAVAPAGLSTVGALPRPGVRLPALRHPPGSPGSSSDAPGGGLVHRGLPGSSADDARSSPWNGCDVPRAATPPAPWVLGSPTRPPDSQFQDWRGGTPAGSSPFGSTMPAPSEAGASLRGAASALSQPEWPAGFGLAGATTSREQDLGLQGRIGFA